MKAAVVTQEHKLEIWDVPVPDIGEYEVLCKICYGATCAGTDLRLIQGGHPRPISYPTILGHESVGRVVEVGKKVKNFRKGDLVSRVGAPNGLRPELGVSWGGMAEYGIARDHWELRRIGAPNNLWDKYRVNQVIWPGIDEKIAPLIITLRETLSYYQRLQIPEGSKVLIIGSGANALAFAMFAQMAKCQAIVLGSAQRRTHFNNLGIVSYIDYKEENRKTILCELLGKRQLFDCIIDAVGSSSTVNETLDLLSENGVIGIYGWNDRANSGIHTFSAKRSFRIYANGYDEEEAHGAVCALLLEGKINYRVWYDTEHPVALEDIDRAYAALMRHEAVKYLIEM